MSLVNIGEGNRDDGFYRYKMPKLITKIEGRGNGIKTNIVNMVDVAKALARPPSYTTKFFGCVLGAQSKFDSKTGTATVNGAHDTSKMIQLLETFIKKYVQCYGCGNPETEILITKTQMITLKCAACGFISDVDMRDKLTTFIINNPPEVKKSKGKKDMRRAEKERIKAGEALDDDKKKSKKDSSKKKGDDEKKSKKTKQQEEKVSPVESQEEDADEEEDDVVWHTDTSAEAAKKRMEEQLSAKTSEMIMLDALEEPKPKPNASNGKTDSNGKHENGVHGAEEDGDEEEDLDEGEVEDESDQEARKLRHLLKDYLDTHSLSEFLTFVNSQGRDDQDFMIAVFETLFQGTTKGLSKEVAKKAGAIEKLVTDEIKQAQILAALEVYCGVTYPESIKEVPLVLKVLYDKEVLEEEHILSWYDQGSKSAAGVDSKVALSVREQAGPFVSWLREAEPESDEE